MGGVKGSEKCGTWVQSIWDRKIDPGKVFDLTLPLEQAAEGYKSINQRRAIKVRLTL